MSINQQNNRIEWLDVLKCIAMFTVLLGHCADTNGPNSLKYYIYSFHMPIFFIISGMSYFLQMQKHEYTFIEILKNKSRTLLWPYFVLNFIALIPWTLNFRILSTSNLTYYELILGIFYGHKNYVTGPSNSTWFILTLFLTIMSFYIIHYALKGNYQSVIPTIIGITAIGYTMSLYKDDFFPPWHFDTVPIALLFVAIGYYFIEHYKTIEIYLKGIYRQIIIFILAILIGYCCARFNTKISMSVNTYGDFLLFIGSVIAFSSACLILSIWLPKLRVLTLIGRNTIVYLVFHMPVFAFLTRYALICDYFLEHPYIKAIVTFILLIPVSWVFENWLYVLIGKRRRTKNNG